MFGVFLGIKSGYARINAVAVGLRSKTRFNYIALSKRRRRSKNKKTRTENVRAQNRELVSVYFVKRTFAVCALAREAAFLCTTPDFTALSMADV